MAETGRNISEPEEILSCIASVFRVLCWNFTKVDFTCHHIGVYKLGTSCLLESG